MASARVFGFVLLVALALSVVFEFMGVVDFGVLDLVGIDSGGGGGEGIFNVNSDIPEGAITEYTPPEIIEWFRSKYNPWDYPATAIWGLPYREGGGGLIGIGTLPFNRTWIEGELNASMSIEELEIDGYRYTVIDIGSGEIDGISLLQYYLYLQHVISQMEGRGWDIFFTIDSAPTGLDLMMWSRNQSIAKAYASIVLDEKCYLLPEAGEEDPCPDLFKISRMFGVNPLILARLVGDNNMCQVLLAKLRFVGHREEASVSLFIEGRRDVDWLERLHDQCSWAVDLLTHRERSVALAYWLTLKIRNIGVHLAELTCNPQTDSLKIKVIVPEAQSQQQLKQAITKYIEQLSNQKPVIVKFGDVNEMAVAEYQLDRGVIDCKALKPAIAYTGSELTIVPTTLLDKYTVLFIMEPYISDRDNRPSWYAFRYFFLERVRNAFKNDPLIDIRREIISNKSMNILRPLVYKGETIAGDIFNIPGDSILGMEIGVLLVEDERIWTRGFGAIDRLYTEFLSDLAFRISSTGYTLVGYIKIAYDPERNVAEIVEERTYSIPVERLLGRE